MPEVVPGSLAEALAALQGQLPHVAKTADAQYGKYADLTVVSEAVLPVMAALGLSFTARPTLVTMADEPRFVLHYELLHASGSVLSGDYPLPTSGSPQQIGSAITYARRYTLCAVTGLAPGGDDDDGQAGEAGHHEARQLPRTGTNASLREQGRMDRKQKSEHEQLAADTVRGPKAERSQARQAAAAIFGEGDPWAQDAPVDHQRAEALRRDLEDRELPEDRPGTSILAQQTQIAIVTGKKGIVSREDKLAYCGMVTGRDVGSSRELSYNEAEAVLKAASELEDANA